MGCAFSKSDNVSVKYESGQRKRDSVGGCEVPPHPPKTKKRDIVPDPTIFTNIDEHALKAPGSLRRSVSELANYLVRPAKTNLERVRAFYRWITDNIRYDTEGFFNGKIISCDPDYVLKTGKSVCQGYADLFSAFCREVNIPVKTISGHAKGFGYNAEMVITPTTTTNHAWNVVLLNGDWRFVECTWGAGQIKGNQFYKQFTEFYFLTDPKDFINKHYPYMSKNEAQDSKWQLLDNPVSMKEFSTRVKLDNTALELGVIPVSHTSGVIEVQSDVTIFIKDGLGNVESWMMTFSESDGTDMGNYAMSYMKNPTTLTIAVRPPTAAKYVLKLFAKPIGKQTDEHNSILEYIIKCSDPAKPAKPYPLRRTPWAFCPKYKQYGFAEKSMKIPIFKAQNGNLCIDIPTTRQVDAMAKIQNAESRDGSLENCTLVESSAKKLVIKARLPTEGSYALDIMAKRPWEGDDRYWPSVSYLIDCRKPMYPFNPFPFCYFGAITKYHCRLLEPLNGFLPAKSSVTFRLESKLLERIRILETNLNKTGSGIFEGKVDIPDTGTITVFGSDANSGSFNGLYRFSVAT
ncbi:hypothetical protein CHS0354_040406 [Potamilus streckersoni]|uniref:Transglutaminase-like domain-containing protein n=1 Tax=Potamilus streckersoni TaxID=2493646 RepID=A0AAE0T0Z1_9BIVA|nr:hypothetical protein CHS0354_040406 [Potamilus streckersoni]